MGRLDSKVAMITGAASGMGAAEARLFAREGAKVVLADIQDELGQEVAREIGENTVYLHLDVGDESQWQAAISATANRFGKLDILVNNAGVSGGNPGRLEEQTVENFDRVMAVNARGVFLGAKYAIPEMRKAGGGSIINISSIYGLVGSARGAGYAASKGAVRIFSKAAAIQYAKDGIRVNSVHPGFIDTPQSARLMNDPDARAALVDRTPIGRIGTSEDIAYGVLFLASDESSYVTGSELVLDGGTTAQ